jgi:transposase-like protein
MLLTGLLDDAKCYDMVRQMRWPEKVRCPRCGSDSISKQGHDAKQPQRQNYCCKPCQHYFDDLSETIFAGRHQSLPVWIGCLYLMGLNLSNRQVAHELGLHEDDAQRMCEQLRAGIVAAAQPQQELSGEVELDEAYVVAGHKGQPDEVKKRGVLRAHAGSKVHQDARRWPKISPRFSG